jgi:hypothetical protein
MIGNMLGCPGTIVVDVVVVVLAGVEKGMKEGMGALKNAGLIVTPYPHMVRVK